MYILPDCTNPVNLKNGDRKSPMNHERYISIPVQVQFFPMNGLAGEVKKKSPMSGEAASGGFFFSLQLLSHKWGKIVTRTGIEMYLE